MSIRDYIKSQSFQGIIIGMVIVVMALIIFQAGVAVGFRKASFIHHFGDNYYRAFDARPGQFSVMLRGDSVAAHGAAGRIVSISLPTFVVSGPDDLEKIVVVQDDTLIRHPGGNLTVEDLRVDNFVVVLGESNDNAQIEAKLIRILPAPPEGEPTGIRMRVR